MNTSVVGSIHIISPEHTLSGLKEEQVAFIGWKVPSFAFTHRQVQKFYVAEVKQIVHEVLGGALPKGHIWVNVVHAVDGGWANPARLLRMENWRRRV